MASFDVTSMILIRRKKDKNELSGEYEENSPKMSLKGPLLRSMKQVALHKNHQTKNVDKH